MYFVAFCEDWCSTVAKSWVDEDTKLIKRPPQNENATTACKRRIDPKSNWLQIKYTRLLGPYKTFDTARQVEMAAVHLATSDETTVLNIDDKENNPSKRTRQLLLRYQKSEESSDDNEEEKDNNQKNKSLPEKNFDYKSNKIVADSDDLLETQPLDYSDFFDGEEYNNLREHETSNKKILVTSIETVKLPFVLAEADKSSQAPQHIFIKKNNGSNDDAKNNNSTQLDNASKDKMPNEIIHQKNSEKKQWLLTIMQLSLVLRDKNKLLPTNLMRQFVPAVTKLIELRKVADGKKHVRDVLAFILDNNFSCKLSWSG
ncbi:uncharacterized protein [Neodiprion pinetum]|uniref:uncharacterized protein n=1 Tax=Neodiprion pinetum TaxID=441929 RepID=UPI001EDD82FC|nr:uncharacterized protein LOC124218883 [Neodiprion pinetum]XP_046481738.1 uncharacterized protein LOC124218887 [Neodiprion pinetum]